MSEKKEQAKVYLIPCPLGEGITETLPEMVANQIQNLSVFIVERAKTARHYIKAMGMKRPIQELTIFELDKHDSQSAKHCFQEAIKTNQNFGVISEAGCPGVADPGALIVKYAHQKNMEIIPLVGPSSILLALMASGMNGQKFTFQGYLPAKKPELAKALKRLESSVKARQETQIFIEAPYRNKGLVAAMLASIHDNTRLCIAVDLTMPTQYIKTQTIKDWKANGVPDLHKRPAIFLLGA